MELAHASICIISVLGILCGAFRSVEVHKERNESGESPDTMSYTEAAIFPIKASYILVGVYALMQQFSKEFVKFGVNVMILSVEILALSDLLSPLITKLVPLGIPNFQCKFTSSVNTFTMDVISLAFCSLIGLWYIQKKSSNFKYWIINNLFVIGFSVYMVGVLHLNNIVIGCILLVEFFVFDVILVFGTNVMDTVLDLKAPVKLLFPNYSDLWEKGLAANTFAYLGIGDIIIPGIFSAFLLRFDNKLNRNSRTYFNTSILAYIIGIFFMVMALRKYRNTQPVLLYLVLCCVGVPLLVAFIKGDLKAMLEYEDYPSKFQED